MKTLEYFRIEARDEFPGTLNHADFADAVSNMSAAEFLVFNGCLRSGLHEIGMVAINDSIRRQYAETIEEIAKRNYADYLESLKDDFDDIQDDDDDFEDEEDAA